MPKTSRLKISFTHEMSFVLHRHTRPGRPFVATAHKIVSTSHLRPRRVRVTRSFFCRNCPCHQTDRQARERERERELVLLFGQIARKRAIVYERATGALARSLVILCGYTHSGARGNPFTADFTRTTRRLESDGERDEMRAGEKGWE